MDLLADYFRIWDAFLKAVNKVSLKCFDNKFVYFYMLIELLLSQKSFDFDSSWYDILRLALGFKFVLYAKFIIPRL